MTIQDEIYNITIYQRKSLIENAFNLLDVSESTKKEYKQRVPFFIDFLKNSSIGFSSFIDFKGYLQKRNDLSVSSKNKYLVVAKILLKEASRVNLLPNDITSGIKLFKETRKHKKIGLSEDDIKLISAYLLQLPSCSKNLRTRAILSLLIFQGLRQIELTRLDVTDLDLENKTALVLGKGESDKQIIDLHPNAVIVLKEYLRCNNIKDGALFYSYSNYEKNKRLSTRSVRSVVQGVFMKLGIEKSVHGIRHYFVSKLIRSYKGDLALIMNYTRHKNITTLQIYNDNLKHKDDLPRYYNTFNDLQF